MAPPTGPRVDQASTRTTRSSTRGRGGIRKSGGPRIGRDGDVIMGNAPIAKSDNRKSGSAVRGGGRGASRSLVAAEKKIRQHLGATGEASLAKRISELPRKNFSNMANRKVFKIVGLQQSKAASNSDRGEKTIVEFIERKSGKMGRGVKIVKSRLDSDFVLHVMISQDDSEEIMKLNGFVFAGASLAISEDPLGWQTPEEKPKLSQESLERKAQLQQVLGQRYDAVNKLLDLSRLGEDPVLIGMGYLDKDRAEKTFKVLMAICDETFTTAAAKREAVSSVSLANNNIDWVGQVFVLAETFPELKNLDLSGNQFKQLKSLNRWRGRFRNLETLLLRGNPIETEEPMFANELLQWFPKLMNLDAVQVRTPEEIAAAEAARAAARPRPIPQSGSDFRDGSGIAEAFLMQFIKLYDTDRTQVAAIFYDNDSQFSLSVTTHTPREHGHETPVLPWAAYLRYSRNLTKITSRSARVQRLVKGAAMIQELWKTLPKTQHPSLQTDLQKYIVDCHPLPGIKDPTGQSPGGVDGLLLTVHGEFEEIDPVTSKTGKRSFTRTFVLGPAVPGGAAPFRVVSDMLSLRAHQQIPDHTPDSASEQEQKQAMIAELSRLTNMTPQYSEMCLAEVSWNPEAAVAKFQELRPNLGPEVFMPAN